MKSHSQSGFALLYAVLLTSVILAIGLGLSSIITKQIVLSSTGASSQLAYYAANTGKECALNWGINGQIDASGNFLSPFGGYVSTDEGYSFVAPNLSTITCNNQTLAVTARDDLVVGNEHVFQVADFSLDANNSCVQILVTVRQPDADTGLDNSEVRATGYNQACGTTVNPRRVERQIVGRGNFATPF